MRMFSTLGRNAQQCCDSYGVSLHSIQAMCKKLAWSMFYRDLDQPELDKIQTIKELLWVKYGLISLPLFDVSQIDFMLDSLCTLIAVVYFSNNMTSVMNRLYCLCGIQCYWHVVYMYGVASCQSIHTRSRYVNWNASCSYRRAQSPAIWLRCRNWITHAKHSAEMCRSWTWRLRDLMPTVCRYEGRSECLWPDIEGHGLMLFTLYQCLVPRICHNTSWVCLCLGYIFAIQCHSVLALSHYSGTMTQT